eukprot:jgi/Bigna1/72958/fgenesh1_pg.22_\
MDLAQGKSVVETAVCSACKADVGWRFVESPTIGESGAIGFLMPAIEVKYSKDDVAVDVMRASDGKTPLDKLAIELMAEHGGIGLSVAFCEDNALENKVLAKAWGYARHGCTLKPSMPLRIASVSKTITSVAVGQLVDEEKLGFDDKVLPLLRRLVKIETLADDRIPEITVRHLLNNTSGLPTNDAKDPMFSFPEKSQLELISHVLGERKLYSKPGSSFHYSNFGYCLLGRVIEAVNVPKGGKEVNTKKEYDYPSYETWVQKQLLSPLGIGPSEAFVTKPTACQYAFTEPTSTIPGSSDSQTKIECQPKSNFHWNVTPDLLPPKVVERMDSHGGWHITPRALVRLSFALQKGKVLSKEVIQEMRKAGCKGSTYGMGMALNSHAQWHNGSLGSTRSIMVHTSAHGGWSWALVSVSPIECLDPFGWSCLNAIIKDKVACSK